MILDGEAVLRIGGEDHPAPAGTFASIEPPVEPARSSTGPRRKVTALLIGVHPSGEYTQPPSFA